MVPEPLKVALQQLGEPANLPRVVARGKGASEEEPFYHTNDLRLAPLPLTLRLCSEVPVAQWLGRMFPEQETEGSNPSGDAFWL